MNPSTSFTVPPQSGGPTLATAPGRSETVEELRRRNELILNAVGAGLYGLDLEGRVTFVNPSGCELVGWTAEELIGRKMHEVLHHVRADGTHFPAEECPIYQTWKDGAIHRSQDDTFWHKDGRAIPVEYVSTPLLEGDRIVGAVVAFSDITSRKRRELELMTLRDELATQVSDMARLQQVSFRLLGHGDYTSLMQDVIESAMALMQADRGNLRLYDPERGSL
jgi:PAS domain S-box-containing protein